MSEEIEQIKLDRMHSVSAEAALLGSMILDCTIIPEVCLQLNTEQFYRLENQILFEAIQNIYIEHNGKVENEAMLILVRNRLEASGRMQDAGGLDYILECAESVPSAASWQYYADIVKDRKAYRDITRTMEDMKQVIDDSENVHEAIDRVKELVLNIENPKQEKSLIEVGDLIEGFDEPDGEYIPSGFSDVDHYTGGFRVGSLCTIGAFSGVGKSTFAGQIAYHAALKGYGVLYVSLEMNPKDLLTRMICGELSHNARTLDINPHEKTEVKQRIGQIRRDNVRLSFVANGAAQTPEAVQNIVRQLKRTRGLDLVIVDYLQLMDTSGKAESLRIKICEISRKLKLLALQEDVTVLALSQLRRPEDLKKRPTMSMLKESGSIEQDSDTVLLIHREDWADEPKEESQTELIIDKNRHGPRGIVGLLFIPEYTKFVQVSKCPE